MTVKIYMFNFNCGLSIAMLLIHLYGGISDRLLAMFLSTSHCMPYRNFRLITQIKSIHVPIYSVDFD